MTKELQADQESEREGCKIDLIELPTFAPRIPPDLLEQMSKRDRDVLNTLTVLAQQMDFNTAALLKQNRDMRDLELRLVRVERWKAMLISRWAPLIYLASLAVPMILERLAVKWWTK